MQFKNVIKIKYCNIIYKYSLLLLLSHFLFLGFDDIYHRNYSNEIKKYILVLAFFMHNKKKSDRIDKLIHLLDC